MRTKQVFSRILCLILMAGSLMLPVSAAGIRVEVQTSYEVVLGETLELRCTASAAQGTQLSYVWYETATGKVEDIFAINRGSEINETFRCDTTELGTRYYVCVVSDGTTGVYSDVIAVRVISGDADKDMPVVFTYDSEPVVGSSMTVDIKKMAEYDAGLHDAFLEGKITYQWYRNGALVSKATSATMAFSNADAGCTYYVVVKGNDITRESEPFQVETLIVPPQIKTTTLPEATAGESYSAQLECYEGNAEFSVYYDPGKANEFDKTGLKLAEDGKITGVPTQAGAYTFTVCAGNDSGEDHHTYTLKVNAAQTDPTETTEAPTQPGVTTVTPAVSGSSKNPLQDDTADTKPSSSDETGIAEAADADNGLSAVIAVVIALAVLSAVAAIVVIVILIRGKKKK